MRTALERKLKYELKTKPPSPSPLSLSLSLSTCGTLIRKLFINIEFLMICSPVNRLIFSIMVRHSRSDILFYVIDTIFVCLQLCQFYVIAYCFQ